MSVIIIDLLREREELEAEEEKQKDPEATPSDKHLSRYRVQKQLININGEIVSE